MKRIEFTAPEMAFPEGAEEGKQFEAMATFERKSGQKLCLVAIGDHKMPGYKDERYNGAPDESKDVAQRYHSEMERRA